MWKISQDKYPIEGPNMFGGHHFLLMLYGLCQVFFFSPNVVKEDAERGNSLS